jgi:hypothetical protein
LNCELTIFVFRTIGMFEQNNVGVRLENPVLTYLKSLNIHDHPEFAEELLEEVKKIRDAIEGSLDFVLILL